MSGVCPWTGLLPNTDIGRIGLQSWFSIGFPYKTWIFQYVVSPGSGGVVNFYMGWRKHRFRVLLNVSERFEMITGPCYAETIKSYLIFRKASARKWLRALKGEPIRPRTLGPTISKIMFCVLYQSRIYLRRTVPSSKTLSTMISTIIAMVTWYLAAHFPHIL